MQKRQKRILIFIQKRMNVPKDVYLHIANFLDDKTVLKMLSVNKKFNDPIFFQFILNRKYPGVITWKKENETWRSFYVKTVLYISKLKEKYNFPYFKNENPEKTYKELDMNPHKEEQIRLNLTVGSGDKTLVKKLLDEKIGRPELALTHVGNNVDMADYLFKNVHIRRLQIHQALFEAIDNKYIPVILYLLDKDISIDLVLRYIIRKSSFDLFKTIIKNKKITKEHLTNALKVAKDSGKNEIVDFLEDKISLMR